MEKQSPTWIFPTARFVVNMVYYFTILAAVIFTLISILRLLNMQPPALTFGEQSPNYVSIPVDWAKKGDATLWLPNDSSVSLNPDERKGELQVHIRSTIGLLHTFFQLMVLTGSVWFFGLLRQIFRHTHTDSPFHLENSRRISQMGLLIIAFSLLSGLYNFLMWMQAKPLIEAMSPEFYAGLTYSFSISGPWIYGLVLLTLAQVYSRGVALQQESELTV